MTLHFLLKWNAEIHRENQFIMMKAFGDLQLEEGAFTPEQQQRWQAIQADLKGTWNYFRVRRKLKHWGL